MFHIHVFVQWIGSTFDYYIPGGNSSDQILSLQTDTNTVHRSVIILVHRCFVDALLVAHEGLRSTAHQNLYA